MIDRWIRNGDQSYGRRF